MSEKKRSISAIQEQSRKQAIAICAAIVSILVCPLFADFGVVNRGIWRDDWPKELETLRERSRTLEGPKQSFFNYAISFTTRTSLRRLAVPA